MGTLEGHLLPGLIFVGLGIWWGFITSVRYVQSQASNRRRRRGMVVGTKQAFSSNSSSSSSLVSSYTYHTSVGMPCICLPSRRLRRAPVEVWVRIVLTFLGILGEAATGLHFNYVPINKDDSNFFGCDSEGNHGGMEMEHSHNHHKMLQSQAPLPVFFDYANAHHITMYAMFLLAAIVELLALRKYDFVPPKLEMACGLFSFCVEAFIFSFHLHSRSPLDIRLHTLLVYAIYAIVICGAFEIAWPNQVLFTYGRAAFTLLQGTWFFQTGFVLYPPLKWPSMTWDRCSHEQAMTVTNMFVWHFILICFGLFVQLWLVNRVYRSCKQVRTRWNELIEIDAENRYNVDDEVIVYAKCPMDDASNDEMIGLSEENGLKDEFNDERKKLTIDEFV